MFPGPMLEINIRWKPLIKFILAWLILWPWFLYNRFTIKGDKSDWGYKCECGEYIEASDDNWQGWYRWRNWLYTCTDVRPSCGEYSGEDWTSHSICWKCGRYTYFCDGSC